MANVLVSVDVETTGPCPAVADLLSFGAVALGEGTLQVVGIVKARIAEPERGWRWEADTRAWWAEQAEEVRDDAYGNGVGIDGRARCSRRVAAFRLADWAETLGGTPVFVAHPACFDWQWVNDLLWSELGRNPFGYRALCIRSLGYAVQGGVDWGRDRTDDPEFYVAPVVPHEPLSDAMAQADQLRRILRHVRRTAQPAPGVGC